MTEQEPSPDDARATRRRHPVAAHDTATRPRTRQGERQAERKGARLQELLEEYVASAETGQRLPSERELAARHGVARMTVRGALDALVAQGLVRRVQGQGTFVAEPKLAQPSVLTSFSEDMAARGMTARSIVLAQEVVLAPEAVARRLELSVSAPIVRLERVRTGDHDPIALERSHLPSARFPGLEGHDLRERSLYVVLAEEYGCTLATSVQRIAALTLTDAEAHLLHAPPATPALRIERVTRDTDGVPVEFVRSVYRGDRFELHTAQDRLPSPGRRDGPITSWTTEETHR